MNSLASPTHLVAALNFVFAAKKGEATPSTLEIVACLCQMMRAQKPTDPPVAPHRASVATIQVM